MVEIKSYPARNGDAFLVKATAAPFAILIDGGYAETFQKHIRSDLEILAKNDYRLDIVVATHIDADHISGLLSLFRQNGPAEAPAIIQVHEVLHNNLSSIMATMDSQTELRPGDLSLLQNIRQRGYPLPDAATNNEHEISARQGISLAHLLREGGYQWNTHDGTTPIDVDNFAELRFPQARIKILGPNKVRLEALKKWWTLELRRLGFVGSLENLADAFELLCAYEMIDSGIQMLASSDAELESAHFPDNSVTNGSSISLILELEGRRMLFLGDSWADDTVAALEPNGPTIFDAVKIAHHGSVRNTSPKLLKLVDSPHFFISTNGESHNHPDFAVLKAIVDRPAAFCRTLHFNYSTPESSRMKMYNSEASADFLVEEEQTDWVAIESLDKV